ncbi:zinc finger protein 106 isoform X2 [Hyla sarda]|uniref:zinc finger protein 106 isoform X2 n=1 Tax=Hyla sarda TaxID=327740 RepID=UPI0024C44E07|nr:zinc finger protein 106 isoform X2 [Hyla sarda]
MVRQRKCILCEIVYSSKKEMDEHMRSMLHHRELENLQGRDCNHECRVCRVTVVGLSTYAKHISSQLHKDNVEALEKEEEKEEAEEEYFDKELVQLINKRKEQSRQEETRYSSKDDEADNYQRRREDRLPFQEAGQQEWLRDPSDRNWQWQNDCFSKSRQSFIHPALNHKSNRHLSNPNGRSGWHINSPSNRHLIHVNVGGTWHSNAGGATSWHQRSTSRNFHWPQEGSENFSNQHPRNCGGNRQSNSYNGNQWKFGNTDAFPQGRNRPSRHSDTVQENDPRWNTKNCASSSFCKERFKWKNVDSKTSSSTPIPNSSVKPSNNTESSSSSKVNSSKNKNSLPNSNVTSSKATEDFTSNKHIADKFLGFKISENLDVSSKTKPTQCSEKSINPLREKPHRWSPYPSQKVSEIQQTTPQSVDKDLADQSDKTKETESGDPKKDQILGDKNVPEFSPEPSDGKKTHHSESTCYRMPSLKSPLCNISDVKVLTLKRDQKNPLKGVKLNSSTTFGERQNRLSALNLETIRSNSYISKLRSASKKTNQEPQDGGKKEPVETLSEVLRKAKEMLRSSQAIQSPYVQSLSNSPNHDNSTRSEASNNSLQTGISFDDTLEDVSDDDFFCSEEKMATAEESNSCYTNQERVEDLKTTENTPSITSFVQFTDTAANSQSNSESLDCENDQNSHPCQDYHDTDTLENVADLELQKEATHLTNTILPELSKLGLPVSLQRDLTRHISSRSKAGSHLPEPNLNSARRIRNVSGHRKSETDKDSGLKPTLRQILNASRRNINWEQVIQHVTKKKQELGKGLPRFGIEMVAQVQSEQEGLDFDEESDLGIESYHWEAITASPLGSSRKRSLSESSVIVEKASVFDIINNHSTESSCGGQNSTTLHITQAASGQEVSSSNVKHPKGQKDERGLLVRSSSAADMTDLSNPAFSETSQSQRSNVDTCAASDSLRMCQSASEDVVLSAAQCIEANNADGATDSCTSSTEQYDGPGVGKKRRATGDGSCPEASNLERNNKRRKLRGRKERSQVDQLLNISIREEELSNSLQGVDSSLLQARASLQAAYMEVQRLMVLKQQISMEMSAMRTQRIQILQGLQETYEPTNDGKEGSNSELQTPVLSPGNVFPFFLETPAFRLSPHPESDIPILPPSVPVCTSPTVPAVPDSSIMIKQEPLSPIIVEDNVIAPQLLPLPPSAQAQSTPPPQTNELTSKFPAVAKTSVSVATSPLVYGSQKTDSDSTENHPAPVQSPQQGQVLTTNISTQETTCSTGPAENGESTLITIETKSGKKKKKLRKKKTLRAAHIPENSDTEQDIDSKPVRKVKCRRLSKETTVSTSTSLEQEGDTASQEAELNRVGNYSDSNIEVMEIKNPRFEVVEIDSHSDDEKPDSPCKNDLADFVCSSQGHIETHDEVTSTSELGTNYSEEILRKAKTCRDSSNAVKISAEVSSEPGEEDQPTEGSFEGHQASVNALQIFDGTLYTCSADKSVRAYNLVTRKCEGVFEGHTSKVNCLLVTQPHGRNAMLYTGSSDHTVRCFSIKSRECIGTLDLEERVLCLHVRWKILYVGLANGTVVTFSIKNNKPIDVFECHGPRAVSCLATAQEGARRLLLVGSYDCTISVRDANNGLLLRTLEGHTKTVLCMKVVNDLVFSGSSDQSVHAHNIHTGELVRIYKGHNHAVTVVNILGKVMVTACLDKFVRVYELQSHDRLQVYGGHSDMIMCMTIHKSMIYTGCYDGSVQAVRLNLIQNYRCWWHGCSLNFGVAEHLKQHLLTDHTNPNFQTLKCRWKNCDAFFTARRGSKQDAIGHIERHAQEDSLINM